MQKVALRRCSVTRFTKPVLRSKHGEQGDQDEKTKSCANCLRHVDMEKQKKILKPLITPSTAKKLARKRKTRYPMLIDSIASESASVRCVCEDGFTRFFFDLVWRGKRPTAIQHR
jgi:hypothetical protein